MKFKGGKKIDPWVIHVKESERGNDARVNGRVQICNSYELYTDIPLIFMHAYTHSQRKAICYQSNHGQLGFFVLPQNWFAFLLTHFSYWKLRRTYCINRFI